MKTSFTPTAEGEHEVRPYRRTNPIPDHRTHRGPHPEDAELFAPAVWPRLRCGVHDLSWLLSHGYAMPSALKIVGDRYELNQRQRVAIMRCACSDEARESRLSRELTPAQLAGATLLIDGYNVLTTIEAALGGAVILIARDTCFRDIASVHGTYRKVEETVPAIELCGQFLAKPNVAKCIWYLDSPVGNSGRLRQLMQATAEQRCWPWEVELSINPDHVMSRATEPVATADSVILDGCNRWLSLARYLVSEGISGARIIDLQNTLGGK